MARRLASSERDTRRRPILGYPSQAAACAALAEQDHSPEEIAAKIGRSANHVRATLRRLQVGERPRTLALPAKLIPGLEREAAARGLKPHELACQLLELIIRDDLFEALLGEAGDA